MASLIEEIYEAVKTLNPQVLVTSKSLVQVEPVTSKDQMELRDAMASLMKELYEAVKTLNPEVQLTSKSLGRWS